MKSLLVVLVAVGVSGCVFIPRSVAPPYNCFIAKFQAEDGSTMQCIRCEPGDESQESSHETIRTKLVVQ